VLVSDRFHRFGLLGYSGCRLMKLEKKSRSDSIIKFRVPVNRRDLRFVEQFDPATGTPL
jgi:hypothetical protein